MIKQAIPCMMLSAVFALFDCMNLSDAGSSVSGNGRITGCIRNQDGYPAPNTAVALFAETYDPVRDAALIPIPRDTTDAGGVYSFTNVESGGYNIEAVQLQERTRALINRITVAGDTVIALDDTLQKPGFIQVMVLDGVNAQNGYMYIPGTSIAANLSGAAKSVSLDSVPAGMVMALCFAAEKSSAPPRVITDSVRIQPGDTTIVPDGAWRFVRKIRLNTAQSGADIAEDVYAFPVLMRLTKTNFDFSLARAHGEDIRFAKPDNTPLPYEIEGWDPVTELAEVWVKVDTVHGGDSTQSLMMYWGNPNAADNSNCAAVFDSAGGFEGVWHLNDTSGTLAADASHNGFTGTYRGGLPRGVPGPSGICQNIMRPDTDYVDMGNVLNPGMKNISLSVWLKRAALSTQQAIIAKTNGNSPSAAYGYLLNFDDNNIPHLYMATGNTKWGGDSTFDVKANLAVSDSTTWHYVSVVIDRSDNALCKMYLDGIDRTGVKAGNVTSVSALANALNLHIGTESDDNCSYSGSIGEVTITFTARSADWVKLCYMNQKGQDALVKW